MIKQNAQGAQTAIVTALPTEWLQHMPENAIYVVHKIIHNEVHGAVAGENINVGTNENTEQIAQMAAEIAQLRMQVQDLCKIIHEYINK